jgi:hypothetical protein
VLQVVQELQIGGTSLAQTGTEAVDPMRSGTRPWSPKAKDSHYTYLHACISEGDDGYLLQVTLTDSVRHDTARGEGMADSFEQASEWLGALAAEYAIAANCIELELRMSNRTDGTRH